MAGYRVIDGSSEIRWLLERAGVDSMDTGVPVPGFESRALLLHSMWEHPDGEGIATHDVEHRAAIEAGEVPPQVIGAAEIDTVGVATGVPLGTTEAPSGWSRLRWADLAARWTVDLAAESENPLGAFRPRLSAGSWPAGIQPPPEGSLDRDSLLRLVAGLEPFTGDQEVFRYSSPETWFGRHDVALPLHVCPLGVLLDLYDAPGSPGSGQNWWPADRSWLIYTDWDLSHTVVHGAERVIESVLHDEELETLRLPAL